MKPILVIPVARFLQIMCSITYTMCKYYCVMVEVVVVCLFTWQPKIISAWLYISSVYLYFLEILHLICGNIVKRCRICKLGLRWNFIQYVLEIKCYIARIIKNVGWVPRDKHFIRTLWPLRYNIMIMIIMIMHYTLHIQNYKCVWYYSKCCGLTLAMLKSLIYW